MYDNTIQPVFRCEQCNKPFDKESTLKRHGYYCRSRRLGTTPRTRSCIACAKGKARCNGKRPSCSRCANRAVDCCYPTEKLKRITGGTERTRETPTSLSSSSPGGPFQEASIAAYNTEDITVDNTLLTSDVVVPDFEVEFLDWDDPDLDFSGLLNVRTDDETITAWPLPKPLSQSHSPKPTHDRTIRLLYQAISSPAVLLPSLPTYGRRSLIHRSKMLDGTQRIAKLLLHTLKSYPLMMLRHNTLPPFIHPALLSLHPDETCMESLSNCISLVNMISSGVQGSRKLFWKNVQLECERLRENHLRLNKWELVAAMQALSIYILIRMQEGETDHNNFDFLLIVTVAAISKQFVHFDMTNNEDSDLIESESTMSWKEWLFQESRRRLAIVYRVLNMLVYFEPAAMCTLQTDLLLAPLPARKQLWEATNEATWKLESQRSPELNASFALAVNGELVKLEDSQSHSHDGTLLYRPVDHDVSAGEPSNWDEWCAGMDGFGTLVMLAASLAG